MLLSNRSRLRTRLRVDVGACPHVWHAAYYRACRCQGMPECGATRRSSCLASRVLRGVRVGCRMLAVRRLERLLVMPQQALEASALYLGFCGGKQWAPVSIHTIEETLREGLDRGPTASACRDGDVDPPRSPGAAQRNRRLCAIPGRAVPGAWRQPCFAQNCTRPMSFAIGRDLVFVATQRYGRDRRSRRRGGCAPPGWRAQLRSVVPPNHGGAGGFGRRAAIQDFVAAGRV